MTLPVSSYEALLVQVRELTHETILLQRQLSSDLYSNVASTDLNHNNLTDFQKEYEQGKLLYDNVIRRCDRKIDIGQRNLVDQNEFAFHSHLTPSFDRARESFSSGELTARLIAWRNENRRNHIGVNEEPSLRRPKQYSSVINSERTTPCTPNIGRVGVDGGGTPSLNSWGSPPQSTTAVGGSTIVRPYYAAGDPPLSRRDLITAEPQSPFATNGVCQISDSPATRPNESREQCQSTRSTYHRNHRVSYTHKGHDMDTTEVNGDMPNSSTPSPELYARTAKRYDEDGSSDEDSKHEDGSQHAHRLSSLYHGTWPVKRDLWTSQQMSLPGSQSNSTGSQQNDMASVMSFSSSTGMSNSSVGMQGQRRLGAKVDVVYSLLGMLGSTEGREDMSSTLLAMSNSHDSCHVMRQSGCLPLLIQLIHAPGQDKETRERASRALRNVVNARSDEKIGRREARVLRLLEQIRDYCQALRLSLDAAITSSDDIERHPGPTIAALMKLSFDEAHRHAMCQLGGLHAVSELIEMDHASHGSVSDDQSCITLRRYAGMALTNLTFGDGNNKALLCSFRALMKALVSQLESLSDDLRQVTASVLRNLSWRADSSSKRTLREVGAVKGLMRAAMEGRKESTLKSILSALWNLSAHCSTNKVDICAVEGALAFLVDMLSYKAPSKTLSIVENAGGILRNVSSHIAVREDYRKIVRERDCLQVLLRQLRSPSLTVVSNACGALWNLSARCSHDQRLLWDLGAVPMLRSLVHSKHKMISMGSSAALKNLLSARPAGSNLVHLDSTARGLGLPTLPTLVARRQRALEQEIDQNLAETCDNIEPSTSPINKDDKFSFKVDRSLADVANSRGARSVQANPSRGLSTMTKYGIGVSRSDSRESMRSVTSTHSDTIFERVNRHIVAGLTPAELQIKQQSSSLHSAIASDSSNFTEIREKSYNNTEKRYALRYKNSITERARPSELGVSEIGDLRCTGSTVSWAMGPEHESACSQILVQSSSDVTPTSTSTCKLSNGRGNSDYQTRKNDSSARDERINCQGNASRSPIGNTTFIAGLVDDTTLTVRANDEPIKSSASSRSSDNDPFEVYAETDLDQPTNYSLRYAEVNSDEDEKRNSGYFAEIEQELGNEAKNYCTPYETPLCLSGAASDNDIPDIRETREIASEIQRGRIEHVARDMRREVYSQKISESQTSKINSDALILNRDVIESSVSSINTTGHSVTERSPTTSPSHAQTFTAGFDAVSATSSIDTTLARLNSLVLSDEPKIINDSTVNDPKFLTIGAQNDSPNVESFTDSMISDGDDDDDDDDEDLLAACIHIGMQNNRHRQSFRRNSLEKTPPAESNLARYQTSIALDQVEINGYAEKADRAQTDTTTRFNIKMTATADHRSNDSSVNGYAFFKDNFNVAPEDDKITVEYQKLHEYSCDQDDSSSPDNADGNIPAKRTAKFNESMKRETRANSVEDNLIHDVTTNDGQPDTNCETRDSVSMESFDSTERTEQPLPQLCRKTDVTTTKNVSTNETILISNDIAMIPKDPCANEEILVSRAKATRLGASRSVEPFEDAKFLPRARDNNQAKIVEDEYRRQRDPDAMIASLDRLTATLVQQTEAMRERESSAMRQSIVSDVWTEDSPNDISYPSISVSAPLIGSFRSDIEDENRSTISRLHEDSESSGMTNSRIIEREAIRLAEAVSAESARQSMNHAANDLGSNDLENATRRPSSSTIDSSPTTKSCTATCENHYTDNNERRDENSFSPIRANRAASNLTDPRNSRKKSLPLGVMAKRALAHGMNNAGSLESLLNDCSLGGSSQLENVMPPSLMDELFDNADMENSMLSVASITSEIADSKEHDSNSSASSDPILELVQPVANVLSLTCIRYAASMNNSANDSTSEYLENINPPSLLNEISDMDDSTIDANTVTMCSDTLCIDAELPNEEISSSLNVERIEEFDNDTDEAITPLTTESCCTSSAESTPKKRPYKSHLTPKQKRQLAKERFKTYTIAAELVKKRKEEEEEENERRKQEELRADGDDNCKIIRGKCSSFTKLTPKQRRQEDPARFQTQVLNDTLPDFVELMKNGIKRDGEKNLDSMETKSSACSSIPTMINLCGGRTFRKTRSDSSKETNDRYRTRTLNDADPIVSGIASIDDSAAEPRNEERVDDRREEIGVVTMQTMLEKNANIVLSTLNETSKVIVDGNCEDAMLDCETLSLVSNDSESEHSLRFRLAGAVLGKKIMENCARMASEEARTRRCEEESRFRAGSSDIRDSDERLETRWETPEFIDSEINDDDDDDDDDNDDEEEEAASGNIEEQPCEAKRPRIVKPASISRDRSFDSQLADKNEPESPKGIRGRRKALYSAPGTRKITPQSSPRKYTSNPNTGIPIGRSGNPQTPVVRSTRATNLRQSTNVIVNGVVKDTARSNNVQKASQSSSPDKRGTKNATLAKRSSIPQRGASMSSAKSVKRHSTPPGGFIANPHADARAEIPTIKPLERQGTFTKCEPDIESATSVVIPGSPTKSKIAKPTRGSPVRAAANSPTIEKSKISVRTQQQNARQTTRIIKCSSAERIQSNRVAPFVPGVKRNGTFDSTATVVSQEEKTNGQASVNVLEIGRTHRRLMSLGQRSNSNSSIVSSASSVPVNASRKLPKEATSKIASLWKKVEDSKNKRRFEKPDTRQWITAETVDSSDGQSIAVSCKPPAFRLFRSSTFEGVTQESDDATIPAIIPEKSSKSFEINKNFTKYRNSCDLTGMTTVEAATACKIPVKFSDKRAYVKETPCGYGTIVLRKQRSVDSTATMEIDAAKRISRLGSFIRVDATEATETSGQVNSEFNARTSVSTFIPSFDCQPRPEVTAATTNTPTDVDNELGANIVTGSARVTTV